ncbi:MAG: thiamine pyrophosphate-dependent enzyme, partial [Pseudomonadota bacterium]
SADSGAHRILLSQAWDCYHPRGLIQSTGLCTMGCALPLAIGHKLAQPETPVAAFMGDAGLEMVLGELATLRDLELPLAVIVLVDESLALIELKQRRSNLPTVGVTFGATDFPAVANAMGGTGLWARTAGDVEEAVRGSLTRDGFTLIACPIPDRAYDGRI